MVPIFRILNMKKATGFYTGILDFELKEPGASATDWVVALINGDAELMLTSLKGDQKIGIATNILVDNIDDLFKKYLQRGLDVSNKKDSPVHQGPFNQSWGNREFYVTNPDGNSLRFLAPIP